ncbi:NADPH:quinone oxidoreductase family protein [Allobranchiibius sp. GilTou73]|uniref:NADPH:quinone oxidoreductase family protein n=1 Tax=Allobranchiibius sp. GilTou73 TaxID=2904523 RepID=UPI001F1BA4C5|nr:NADPH:quinone oxidoreductase family protein [Allobranchiibius sp. GilTou73]UIJ34018.1 NADPH:quinone oxidoreductase family protein [Allobranchiibius sp. GilTou73]
MMRALRIEELGQPNKVLEVVDVPVPDPGAGQIAVRVLGAALNFPDVLMCRGSTRYAHRCPSRQASRCAVRSPRSARAWSILRWGARVLGSPALPSGGFAQFALMEASDAHPAPAALDDAQAASFWIGYQTSWFALHRRAALQPGETLLVHAAAGGVGSSAVQLGKAAGARVIGVVGGGEKAVFARELGADIVVDRHTEDFVQVVKDATGGRGADVIYDPVGGDTYDRSTKCIAFEGRIVVIGFAGGRIQSAALNHALIKNYSILGLHWGLYKSKIPGLMGECHEVLSQMAQDGVAVPLVSERVGLEQVPDALQRLGDGSTVGRVVMVP